MTKEKIIYHSYPLKKIIRINGWEFREIIISSHFEKEHCSYMTDEKILAIAKQLDKREILSLIVKANYRVEPNDNHFSENHFSTEKKPIVSFDIEK